MRAGRLRGKGLTTAEIGRALDRDPRSIRRAIAAHPDAAARAERTAGRALEGDVAAPDAPARPAPMTPTRGPDGRITGNRRSSGSTGRIIRFRGGYLLDDRVGGPSSLSIPRRPPPDLEGRPPGWARRPAARIGTDGHTKMSRPGETQWVPDARVPEYEAQGWSAAA